MARIICQLREEVNQTLLENGVAGVGGLQTREFGYTDEAGKQWGEFKTEAGAFRQFPTVQRLDDAAAAASAGAKLIGYFPSNGMTSVDVQAAIDELRTAVAAGTGTVTGSGTLGRLMRWTSANAAGDSILAESGSGLLATLPQNAGSSLSMANANAGASAYAALLLTNDLGTTSLYAASSGYTDVDQAANRLNLNMPATALGLNTMIRNTAGTARIFFGTPSLSTLFYSFSNKSLKLENINLSTDANGVTGGVDHAFSLTKNDANTRAFYGHKLRATLNAGGSNAATTLYLLDLDTVNTSLTGLTTRLLRIGYGGVDRLLLTSTGKLSVVGGGGLEVYGDALFNDHLVVSGGLQGGGPRTIPTPVNLESSNFLHAEYDRNVAGAIRHAHLRLLATLNPGGSNSGQTLDVLEVDTVNTGVTGITVNLMRLLYGGAERARVSSGGVLSLMAGTPQMNLYSVGGPDSSNFESVGLSINSTNATLSVAMGGTGVARPLYFALSNTVLHAMHVNGNIGFGSIADDYGGGVGVIRLQNAGTVPSSSATASVLMYSEGGAAKVRGASGTVTTFGPAEPHCPACGADFMKEFQNEKYGYLAFCMKCMADELGPRKWIVRNKQN